MLQKKMIGVPFAAVAFVLALAATAFACTNYVGEMQVRGDNAATGTVSVVGGETWNHASEAMTQTVSSAIAKADRAVETGTNGNFRIWTGPKPGQSGCTYKLGNCASSTTLDVNWFNGGSTTDGYGYTNHTTWNNPLGDCMTWNVPVTQVSKLGTITVDSSGNVSGGAGTKFVSYDSANKWAWFKWDVANAKVSVSPKESAVCVSTSNSVNGNQAPITVI